MFTIDEYRQIRKDYFGETFSEASDGYYNYKAHCRRMNKYQEECIKDMKAWSKKDNSPTKCKSISTDDFMKAKKALEKANIPVNNFVCTFPNNYPVPANFGPDWTTKLNCPKQQEGINPMRSYNDTYASASISNPKSDAAVQRDYLTQQLNNAARAKTSTFPNLFNIYIDNTPKTFKDLIDAIKNDKFTIDPKAEKRIADWDDEDGPCYYGPLHGIIFAGPQPDRKGYDAAQVDAEKQKTTAERIIVTGDAAAGLAALEAFEAWQPTVATTTTN